MLTRGFRWLSNRTSLTGDVQRPLAMQGSAIIQNPVVSADKIIHNNVQAMLGIANIVEIGLNHDVRIATLPLEASAIINGYQLLHKASPMLVSAEIRQGIKAITSSADEVVLYIYHADPILYLREDIIK